MSSQDPCAPSSLRPAREIQIPVPEENFTAVVEKIEKAVNRAHATEKESTEPPITSHQGDTAEKALISVRLQGRDDIFNIEQWGQQLAQSIPEVAGVKVQAVFKSAEAHRVVMLTMPKNVWAMLEDNEAFSFADFVTSDILCAGTLAGTLEAPVPEGLWKWN